MSDEVYPSFDVLVVDDPATRDWIMAYFHSVGMPVAGAHDGRTAIAAPLCCFGRVRTRPSAADIGAIERRMTPIESTLAGIESRLR